MSSKRNFLPIIAAALGFYPIYGTLLFTIDTLVGSRQLLNWVGYESHHALFHQSIADAIAALGAGPGFAALLALALLLAWPARGAARKAILLATFLFVPLMVLVWIGFALLQATLIALAWFLSTLVALILSRTFTHAAR